MTQQPSPMGYDCIVVGGGMAGLTAAAYLAGSGHSVLLCEKEHQTGGLLNSFYRDGFLFDGGIRAIENSGIIFPMLRQLGIDRELTWVRNDVTIGIGPSLIHLGSQAGLPEYVDFLTRVFPESEKDIKAIAVEIGRVLKYMDVVYGIDNPLFIDLKHNPDFLRQTLLPWLPRFLITLPKINRVQQPIRDYLGRFTQNMALIDMITQHFFKETPAYFALSYFRLYQDYSYPLGGTSQLAAALERFVKSHGGEIRTGSEIVHIDPARHSIRDSEGRQDAYRRLVWAADLKRLYAILELEGLASARVRQRITARRDLLSDKTGGDSVLTVYLEVDMDPAFFAGRTGAHAFYTPQTTGLGTLAKPPDVFSDGTALREWLKSFFALTTYEITCPVLRDSHLAPPGKTGLIVSTLLDCNIARQAQAAGWYEHFKAYSADRIIEVLDRSVFPGLAEHVLDRLVATPLSIARLAGTTDGAITGWAFTNRPVPAVNNLAHVAKSVRTPIPDVLQAGQWVFSPSGLPIAALTGKLAADQALRGL